MRQSKDFIYRLLYRSKPFAIEEKKFATDKTTGGINHVSATIEMSKECKEIWANNTVIIYSETSAITPNNIRKY